MTWDIPLTYGRHKWKWITESSIHFHDVICIGFHINVLFWIDMEKYKIQPDLRRPDGRNLGRQLEASSVSSFYFDPVSLSLSLSDTHWRNRERERGIHRREKSSILLRDWHSFNIRLPCRYVFLSKEWGANRKKVVDCLVLTRWRGFPSWRRRRWATARDDSRLLLGRRFRLCR